MARFLFLEPIAVSEMHVEQHLNEEEREFPQRLGNGREAVSLLSCLFQLPTLPPPLSPLPDRVTTCDARRLNRVRLALTPSKSRAWAWCRRPPPARALLPLRLFPTLLSLAPPGQVPPCAAVGPRAQPQSTLPRIPGRTFSGARGPIGFS